MLEPYVRPGIDDRPDLDKVLSPEDKAAVARLAIKNRRRPPEAQWLKRNLELTLSTDSQLRAWFAANKPAVETLLHAYEQQPAPRAPALDRDPAPGLGPSLKALGLTAIEDVGDGIRVTIGGMLDNTVGFFRAGPSGPPPISPSEFIWVEDLGGGWFLFRTT